MEKQIIFCLEKQNLQFIMHYSIDNQIEIYWVLKIYIAMTIIGSTDLNEVLEKKILFCLEEQNS